MDWRAADRLLRQHGWVQVRTEGSHYIYEKPDSPNSISVLRHGHDDLSRGLVVQLRKLTGIPFR
jgi:predicted RNA binding protein YcfA (HicA-like mRNA interferase family)